MNPKRVWLLGLVLMLVGLGVAICLPVVGAGTAAQSVCPTAIYYPIGVGYSWSYVTTLRGEAPAPTSCSISKTFLSKGTTWYYRMYYGTGGAKTPNAVRNNPTGTYAWTMSTAATPILLIKAPVAVGTTWMANGTNVIAAVNQTVKVPAGTFTKCIMVKDSAVTGTAQSVSQTWYAPGVGEVKRTFVVNGATIVVDQLKAYKTK